MSRDVRLDQVVGLTTTPLTIGTVDVRVFHSIRIVVVNQSPNTVAEVKVDVYDHDPSIMDTDFEATITVPGGQQRQLTVNDSLLSYIILKGTSDSTSTVRAIVICRK